MERERERKGRRAMEGDFCESLEASIAGINEQQKDSRCYV